MTKTTAHRILLVEDDLAWAELTREAFLEVAPDTHVDVVHDGDEAIARVSGGEPPDVILLDLNMPGTDGRDVMRTIRSLPNAADMRVMILSASVSARDRDLAGEVGVDAYANKPTTFSALCRLASSIATGTLDTFDDEAASTTAARLRASHEAAWSRRIALLGDTDLDVATTLIEAGVDIVPVSTLDQIDDAPGSVDCVVIAAHHPDAATEARIERAVAKRPDLPVVVTLRRGARPDLPPRWMTVEVVDIEATRDELLGQTLRLAIERASLTHKLREERSFLDAVIESVDVGVIACDRFGTIRVRNAAAELLPAPRVDGPSAHIVAVAENGQASPVDESILQRALRGEVVGPVEVEGVDEHDALRRWIVEAHQLLDGANRPLGAVALCRDVTERHQTERALTHRAEHDPLTGLPNRAFAFERLQLALDRGTRRARQTAVLFVDLDHFKAINDTAGHAAGDTVLQTVGLRLRHAMRSGDTVARLGGDEFVVLSEVSDHDTAEALGRRLHETIAKPMPVAGSVITPTASIGIVVVSGAADAQRVLDEADAAMYEAKRLGRARSYLTTPEPSGDS